ncbi:hypothetical protein HF313_15730 [Massilia atriviolacea]|uniref:Cytochrome c domain-containing protein n=1 Tax=Massilia atriviolacea TaxID=2495579 RepID=A0A430HCK7_9BURK|nr:hypothetical protein [Massilia atriviolacea]RSZ55276.1 hypothetical protein EJB06_30265 [Massilia atriviolacea]
MKLRDWILILMAVLALAADLPARASQAVAASGGVLASGVHSDRLAWQHFAAIVAPASRGRVEFETWAADEDIYSETPAWPGPAAQAARRLRASVLRRLLAPHGAESAAGESDCGVVANAAAGNFPVQSGRAGQVPCFAEEVRRNRATYRYIVQNQLNTQAGLAAAYQKAQGGWRVSLPEDAVQVKADWVPFDTLAAWLARNGVRQNPAQLREAFYTTLVEGRRYALVAMHVSSKDAPNWVWASFEHRFNPGRCDTMGCNDSYGATRRRIAPLGGAQNRQYAGCAKTAALKKLFEVKRVAAAWDNYCLKASEIAFTARDGAPLMHGNSFTERVGAGIPLTRSSCISCHASAGFGRDGSPYTKQLTAFPMGTVKLPADIVANDFIWGILTINALPVEQASTPHNLDRTRITARR